MYLLDTNILSELRKSPDKRDARVTAWIRSVSVQDLYISTITIYELELGVKRVERRDHIQGFTLRHWLNHSVLPIFEERILPFDVDTAKIAADLHVPDQKPLADSFIAATAMAHHLVLATRNIKDFKNIDVSLINPFEFAG